MPRPPGLMPLLAGCAALGASTADATPDDVLVMARNLDAISTFDPAQIGEAVTNEIIQNTATASWTWTPRTRRRWPPAWPKAGRSPRTA